MRGATWRTKEARYLIWLLCLAGAVAFYQFVPEDSAYAGPSASDITYSPTSYSTRVLPGQQTTLSLQARSPAKDVTVTCPHLVPSPPSQAIPDSWVSSSPSTYTFTSLGWRTFSITISVPAQAAGGTYESYIRCHVISGPAADGTGCLTALTVGCRPACSFTFSPSKPQVGQTVQFTDQSTDSDGTIVSWAWNFGDGGTSTSRNPTHTYGSAGTYTVSLTVTDNDGLTATCSQAVKVLCPPVCGFTFSPAQPKAGQQVQFTDRSTDSDGTVVSWSWSFGDGRTSTTKNPTHSYSGAGSYTVTLTVTDNDGLTSTCQQTVQVAALVPPTCGFSFSPSKPLVGQSVQFTDQSSDPDGAIASWAWNFGDGSSSTAQNPTHPYASYGTYTVSLTVTDNDGLTSQCSQNIEVVNPDEPPVCGFTFSPEQPKVGEQVQFTDQSTDSDGSIVSWGWNFGDGGTSSAKNPTHAYASYGTYTVSLTVTDNDGLTATCSQAVKVLSPPICGFTFSPAKPKPGQQVQFTDQSTDSDGTVVSWSWSFGEGGTSTTKNPTHTYGSAGTYTVKQTVTDNDGLTATCSQDVVVLMKRTCSFTFTPQNPNAGQEITFQDESPDPGDIVSWSWDFGDGATSSAQNPSHIYSKPDSYTVNLDVAYSDGQTTSCSQQVSVGGVAPAAAFSWLPDSPAEGQAVQFSDHSADGNPGGSIVAWAWNFGDGQTASVPTPAHVFVDNGDYPVTLTVTNSYGLSASISQVVSVRNVPPTCNAGPSREARVGDEVTLVGQAQDAGALDTLSFQWNFGDGQSDTGQTVKHAYQTAGSYRVTLTVVDKDGGTGVSRTWVQVGDQPSQDSSEQSPDTSAPIEVAYVGDAVSQPDGTLTLSARLTPSGVGMAVWPKHVVFSVTDVRGRLAGRFFADVVGVSGGDEAAAHITVQLSPGVYFAWADAGGRGSSEPDGHPVNLIAVGAAKGALWGGCRGASEGQVSAAVAVWGLDTAQPRAEAIGCVQDPSGSMRVVSSPSMQVVSAGPGRVEAAGFAISDGVHGLPFRIIADAAAGTLTILWSDGGTFSYPLDAGAITTQ